MFEEELRELYKDAKKQATELFTKTCIGDESVTFLDDLKSKFKQKFDQLKVENERAASTKAQAFLQNYFSPIEHKLRQNEYSSFSEFERDINQF